MLEAEQLLGIVLDNHGLGQIGAIVELGAGGPRDPEIGWRLIEIFHSQEETLMKNGPESQTK